jgi:hypothetical protein
MTVFYVIQDHPVYIPCGQRWPLRPELEAVLGVSLSSQLAEGVGGSSCLLLLGALLYSAAVSWPPAPCRGWPASGPGRLPPGPCLLTGVSAETPQDQA